MRILLLFLVLALAGCAQPQDEPQDVPDEPVTQLPCNDCHTFVRSDAFEPDLAVRGDTLLVAHTPFVDQARTLSVVVRMDGNWLESDIGSQLLASDALMECTHIFDPAAVILEDGTLMVVAIAGGTTRVLFSTTSIDGVTWSEPQAIVPATPGGCLLPRDSSSPDFVRPASHVAGETWIVWREFSTIGCRTCFGLAEYDGTWTNHFVDIQGECVGSNSLPNAVYHGEWTFASSRWGAGEPTDYCRGTGTTTAVDMSVVTEAEWGWPVLDHHQGDWVMAGSVPVEDGYQTMLWTPDGEFAIGNVSTATSATQIEPGPWVLYHHTHNTTDLRLSNGTADWLLRSDVTKQGANTIGAGHYIGFQVVGNVAWAAWVEGESPNRNLVIGSFNIPS